MSAKTMKRVEGFGTLSTDQRAELEQLAAMPEDSIDTGDAPELSGADPRDAMRLNGKPLSDVMDLYRARKTAITASLMMLS